MKEGYLQKKIAEFSEKLQDFNHRLNMAETEFERYQQDLGYFKDLIKQLKHVEEFQQKGVETIQQETKQYISDQISQVKIQTEKEVDKTISKKSQMISEVMEQIQQDEKQFTSSLAQIKGFSQEIQYFTEFQKLFMLKLINKGILNHRELSEIELRAKKRVKEK